MQFLRSGYGGVYYYIIGIGTFFHHQCHVEVRLLFEAIYLLIKISTSHVQAYCNRGLQQNLDIYFQVETKTKGGPFIISVAARSVFGKEYQYIT